MYEKLTNLLPELSDSKDGEWIIDHKNDGTEEHPIQFPFVVYHGCYRQHQGRMAAFHQRAGPVRSGVERSVGTNQSRRRGSAAAAGGVVHQPVAKRAGSAAGLFCL